MATQSGGVDWPSTIKPLLALLQGTNIGKSELIDLINALSKSDAEFQDYDSSQENFFTPLAILSAHLIASNTSYLGPENLSATREACSVIIRHLLLKLSAHNGVTLDGPPAQTISIKNLLIPLALLCGSEETVLSHADVVVLSLLLKDSKVPVNANTGSDFGKSVSSSTSGQSSDRAASQRRADGLAEVLTGPLPRASAVSTIPVAFAGPYQSRHQTLTTVTTSTVPLTTGTAVNSTDAKTATADITVTADTAPIPILDVKKWLAEMCTFKLGGLGAGGTLITLCGALPCLQRHLSRFRAARDAGAAACPYQHHSADIALVSLLVSEVLVCQIALSLPCLEPLTPPRVALITDISAAWLLCATAQAAVHLKDEEAEVFAAALVEGALRLFNTIGDVLKNSIRAGGYVYQNHLMIGTWVLLSGLHQSLMGAGGAQGVTPPHASKSPARAPSRPYNLARIQQGVHVTWVALGSRCLEGARILLADARLEAQATPPSVSESPGAVVTESAANLDPLKPNTAGQRAARLAICAPLHQLLVVLGVVCYRKATSLKRAVVHKQHEQDADRSDSTVYYQDMIMCSEDSETDDEDSEPLLGLWFEATLVAPDGGEGCGGGGGNSGNDSQDPLRGSSQPGLVPDKAEPYSYISLATEVFSLLNGEVLNCGPRLGNAVSTLQESQVALLAALVRDLDRETARTDTGTISPCFGARLGTLYGEFSAALVRYLHSLTGSPQLGALRQILLEHLGAAPAAPQEQSGLMPLQVGCRVVKLMGGVILGKPVVERETAILSLWNKTVNTVVECALQVQPSQDHEYEDMNVEHAQLLVYLFHSLNLMQKKSVLLMTANAIIKVSDALGMPDRKRASQVAPHQLMLTTRLLLLFEYLMKHLYDAPPWLLHQIFWNLAAAPGLVPVEPGQTPPGASSPSRTYCPVPHIEQAYRRRVSQDADVSMRPKFYSVADTTFSNQETPKLDGLACNFVLGTPDKLKYPLLLDALLSLLQCAGVCDRQPPPPLTALCAAHYCFQTAWRLLITLPPSTPHVEHMSDGTAPLHALVWAPRAGHHKTFSPWLKDTLVKQGMYTQSAENLLSGVATSCDNISYTVWLATQTIKRLRENIGESGLPCLWDVMTADCVLMRLRVSLCDETQLAALTASQADADLTRQFMPHLLDLMDTLFECCRMCSVRESGSSENTTDSRTAEGVLRCCGARGAPWLRAHLPVPTRSALDRIAAAPACDMPPSSFLNDAIPSESAVLQLLTLHCQLMSYGGSSPPLQLLASGAVELLAARVTSLLDPERAPDRDRAVSLLLPATVDARLEFLQKTASTALSALLPTTQKVEQSLHEEVLRSMFPVMRDCPSPANEKILRSMVKYWEKVLERPAGRSALESLHVEGEVFLGQILISAHNAGQPYAARVIKLLNKLFASCDSSDGTPSPICGGLCQSMAASTSAAVDLASERDEDEDADPDRTIASIIANGLSPAWLSHLCLGAALPPRAAASTPSESDPATPTAPPAAPAASASVAISQPTAKDLKEPNEGSNNSSPAPRNGHTDPAQQSVFFPESCSWSGGASDSKESVAIALLTDAADNTDNATLLSNLTKHTIIHCNRATSLSLLRAIVSLTGEALGPSHAGLPLPRLLREAARLADAHTGMGHRLLFPAAVHWLNTCVESLCAPDVLDRLEEGGASPSQRSHLDAACHLLAYVTDALHAAGGGECDSGLATITALANSQSASAGLAWDVGDVPPLDADWPDDTQDDDDTSADDSDEDSMLHLKLCTFTTTAREFMNQHWYHCHTCKMVDGVGVCTVCALVCHRSHDVSYAKFGNFFCDCGAKEDSSCQALVKRSSSQSLSRRGADSSERVPPSSSLRRRPSSPPRSASPPRTRRPAYASNLQGARDWIANQSRWPECVQSLQRLLAALAGPVKASCERHAAVGRHGRARRALAQLHHGDKRFHTTDQLMVPTLGSQEGAFENVRMSYTGEQGQAIRQLISAHMVRRVAMCCLALPHGRRQNLAVSHEKGKVTILQLSALLKQADSSKRKLTLTRLTSAPIPFTVLTLSANPWNEDVLAVCGLRECHVITFNGSGSVYDRLVMQPALDPGNFIIRGIWLPGEQTALALVTADFVKIYDLSKDASQPEYHFLVPSGKVRDVTFVTQETGTFMLCMGSAGHIYWQAMNQDSHASNGPFYITNTVEVQHNDIKDVTGQLGGGGVSIYYSHTLKILFFSYAQGKSFMAPLISVEDTLKGVSLIAVGGSSGGSGSGSQKEGVRGGKGAQSLCQWQEVPGHPGLVTAVLQASNNPVVIMLKPGSVAVQEIKVVPAKAKITDMVAVRHSSGQQEHKTTLILLCEDGSLRIYAASPDHTGFWLSPAVAPPAIAALTGTPQPGTVATSRGRRSRHPAHNRAKTAQSSGKPGAALTFPIDFFEHCAGLSDVEFGGNDLLQVYNTAQIKHRLNTNSLYVVSTKLSGFVVEVTNSDPAAVITGIRVLLGNQDVTRTPTYIEVCGRSVPTVVTRSRWYDIPLTREESLQADKKLSITFGSSQDPEGVIMVDSIKVYGRNKEAFGWPEENEDSGACNSNGKVAQESEGGQSSWTPPGVERLACSLLEALELSLASAKGESGDSLEVATGLLCAPCPPPIHTHSKALLRALLGSNYHLHRDQAILAHVMEQLTELWEISDPRNADPENFFRLVLLARGVAVSRPDNLIKYAGPQPVTPLQPGEWCQQWYKPASDTAETNSGFTPSPAPLHLAPLLAGVLWRMESVRSPSTPTPAPSLAPVDQSGLRHTEHVLHAFVDVMHALMINSDDTMVEMGNRIYLSLLLAKDQVISFGAKAAIVRALRPRIKKRRVYIPSPPTTPGIASGGTIPALEGPPRSDTPPPGTGPATPPADHNDNEPGHFVDVDQVVDMSRLLGADGAGLEALLGIPADADDETMVELAIVLSLQEGNESAPSSSRRLHQSARRLQQQRAHPRHSHHPSGSSSLEAQGQQGGSSSNDNNGSGAVSDATASAGGSDDEDAGGASGNPPESPGEQPGSAGSESGSGGDSIGGVSGRSSAYGEAVARQAADAGACDSSQWPGPSGNGANGSDGNAGGAAGAGAEAVARLRQLRLQLLKVLLAELPQLRNLPGLRTIPFMQVLLMLANALDTSIESEQQALKQLLTALVSQLDMNPEPEDSQALTNVSVSDKTEPVQMRTSTREMQLLIMRLLSVLMSRWKPPVNGGTSPAPGTVEYRTAKATAVAMAAAGSVSHCCHLLRSLLPYWRQQQLQRNNANNAANIANNAPAAGVAPIAGEVAAQPQLLRPQPPHPLPDMQPFFLRQYVKGHAWDVLENYAHLLTEMALRLPYQVHKHCDPAALPFAPDWHDLLCEYMMNQQTPFLKKQVRKLLLMMCGTKEKYRQLRDVHALSVHLEGVHEVVETLHFSYDSMVQLMEHLKACVEIVVARTGNWQHLCTVNAPGTLSYLMGAACILDEGVAPTVLQLIQCALCPPANPPNPPPVQPKAAASSTAVVPSTGQITGNERSDRERSADSDASVTISCKFQEQIVPQLVTQIQQQISVEEFRHFIRVFLLETNSTAVRWQVHALLLAMYENSTAEEQTRLVNLMWGLWPLLPQYGRKSSQFVDLLGYFSLKTPNMPLDGYLGSAVDLLKNQNNLLMSHGNGPIYSALSNYVELDGYYLESEPCLVCNNPEVPMATIKLSTIRIDSKFTTTTQIVKLVGSHTISRIGLRIGDLKRSKMVRAINVFYNNRTVQAVQELKNKPGMWHKAKQVVLQSGQTEVRIDFQLPIVACNLMMEYADFYENTQASGESLQCPRCSAAVPANPGVCANCGENVFQCHKCRAINYDEKDPFLCHACGFCKYAKFDYTLTGRPCCAVDAIENDEDRKKMVAAIGLLLDKADRVYRQLVANKPIIENMLHKITEHRLEGGISRGADDSSGSSNNVAPVAQAAPVGGAQVNRVIQYVAHKYCVDSKNHFDDLSKIIQRVLTCRRELVAYDRAQSEQQKGEAQAVYASLRYEPVKTEADNGNCYGCALSAASHCLTLLRALASSPEHRQKLCRLGLVQELVQHNLRRGTPQSQEEVRQLICVVTRDNLEATKNLCRLVTQRITLGLVGHAAAQDHTNAVRPLVLLLGGLVKIQDSVDCWEVRLRCIVRLWIWCCPYLSEALGSIEGDDSGSPPPRSVCEGSEKHDQDPHALQQVALPCLQYLHHLMQPALPPPPVVVNKDKSPEQSEDQSVRSALSTPMEANDSRRSAALDLGAWLAGKVSYAEWKRLTTVPSPLPPPPTAGPAHFRDTRLAIKYTARWREKTLRIYGSGTLCLGDGGWLQPVVFSPSSKMARDTACQMVKSLCTGYERTKAVLVLLTNFLPGIGAAGESSEQFLQLYQSLASEAPWKQFLALRGVLSLLADLLTKEIDHLHKLEENTLTSDMAQGYALKRLTKLLAMFLEDGGVRRAYKGRLMGAVLGGYLSLRRLVVQRTRLIDDTQEKLLELLEEMTTGTEAETAEFMAVCIETVKKYPLHDFRTPVFIFERLCSIIHPEENDIGEFFLSLEKDPQQEDFLQGRMLGNPYSSLEAGLGPLMRDVKNKICADCELVALLEDDNGMELLVNNKIMSLDLPVKDVYKKVWAVSGEGDAMRVVYRMRGLLGDATEEFVETLTAASAEEVDDEQLYRMANVLADCGGLEVMLERLAEAGGAGGAARPLARTLLRLLSLCTRARRCVALLTQASTSALPALLKAAQIAAKDEAALPRPELTCQLLEIMDRILSVAASESLESFLQFSLTFGGPEYVQALLNCTECPGIRNNSEALAHLTRVLAALVYGNDLKMAHLCQHFKLVLDFNKFDAERWAEDEFRLELFCVLCSGIERNSIGGTLKDYIISLGIVKDALDYITMHAPCVKPTLLRTDSDELKEFISKPALKYILRFLTGLATDHEPTQMVVCEKVIPIVHRLEQVSSDEHVGSLAENLLEALMSEPEAAKKVQEARDYTRQEKKRLAMAMREKQLGALGMRTNDKGQVTAQCSLTHQVQELGEETGAVCCICREGYKYQPTKVLGIYTFTKRCGVDEFEVKPRKTLGYTTVTHFNVVHVECHMAAVRLARVRDEWESAALQNASTRCNGLLPLWGPHVPESAFASCLARHNTYLQECTAHRDIGYQCTVHDLKLLLMRFAREKSFHEDTGGGGPLSNMQLVPCLAHMALYVINTTRVAARELIVIQSYMEWPLIKQLESAHDAEGPLYYAVIAVLLQPPEVWAEERIEHLRRLLYLAQARALCPGGPPLKTLELHQQEIRPYQDYKPYLMFYSLLQLLYDVMFKHVSSTPADQWPVKLAEAIRHGDETVLRSSEKILATFTEQFLPCASFAEWCDVAELPLTIRENPDEFLSELFSC